MGQLPATPLLRWSLIALVVGIGGMVTVATGLSLIACQCGVNGLPLFLATLALTVGGLVAAAAQLRRAWWSDLASLTLFAAVVIGFIGLLGQELVALNHRVSSTGELVRLTHESRRGDTTYRFTLADGQWLTWDCRTANCARRAGLDDLPDRLPLRVDLITSRGHVLGLSVDGQARLRPDAEVPRQVSNRVIGLGFAVMVLTATLVCIALLVRRHRTDYSPPPPGRARDRLRSQLGTSR